MHAILNWCFEAVHEGIPLPPAGFVADVAHLVFGEEVSRADEEALEAQKPPKHPPYIPSTLIRQYEDLVLGKLYGDRSFERAADALRRYSDRRDRARGLAYFFKRFRLRGGYRGITPNEPAIRNLQRLEGADVLAKAAESLETHGPILLNELPESVVEEQADGSLTLMEALYHDLIQNVRSLGEVLGPEDIFLLEHDMAIVASAQEIALELIVKAAAELGRDIPHQPVRAINRRHQVATQIVDEDTYPIGGFSSLSNRGTIESLLHSQLAYMEQGGERPDMFDIKFLRDELLYYARDENLFLRRRRSFVFALFPDLAEATENDGTRFPRIILLLAMLRVTVERLTDWLSEEALLFEFVFLRTGKKSPAGKTPLADEEELIEMLFREQIANSTVAILELASWDEFTELCDQNARRSLCNAVILAKSQPKRDVENTRTTQVALGHLVPAIAIDAGDWIHFEESDRTLAWSAALVKLLEAWVAG